VLIIVMFTLYLLIAFSLFAVLYVFYCYHFFGEIKMYIYNVILSLLFGTPLPVYINVMPHDQTILFC